MTILFDDNKIILKSGTVLKKVDAETMAEIGTYTVPQDVSIDTLTTTFPYITSTPNSEEQLSDGAYFYATKNDTSVSPYDFVAYAMYIEEEGQSMTVLDIGLMNNTVMPSITIASGVKYDSTSPTGMSLTDDAWGFTYSISNITVDGENYFLEDSVARTNKQDKLTAGSNIQISGSTISATVNNNTVTIKQGTVTKGSFTLNQNSDTTITLDNTSSGALSDLTDVQISSPTQGQNLTYDSTLNKWKNTSTTATVAWGGITGTLSDQTDLQNVLNAKQATMSAGTGIGISNNTININQAVTLSYNVDITGTLTNTNGVLSGFGSTNYATIPVTFNPGLDSWELVIKFKTGSTLPTRYSYLYGTPQNSNSIVVGQYSTGVLTLWLGSEGSTNWDICADQRGTTALSLNTDYLVRVAYNSNVYTMSISTDGGTSWNQEVTLTNSSKVHSGTIDLGSAYDHDSTTVWNGTIDLNNSSLKITGQGEVWKGVITNTNIAKATENLYGLVKPDGTTITISDGVISSSSSVEIDNTTITRNASNKLQATSLVDLTATVTELNYVDGVTSNVQTQLDAKQATLTAGDNITIANNVISANYPTYIESTKTLKFGD